MFLLYFFSWNQNKPWLREGGGGSWSQIHGTLEEKGNLRYSNTKGISHKESQIHINKTAAHELSSEHNGLGACISYPPFLPSNLWDQEESVCREAEAGITELSHILQTLKRWHALSDELVRRLSLLIIASSPSELPRETRKSDFYILSPEIFNLRKFKGTCICGFGWKSNSFWP